MFSIAAINDAEPRDQLEDLAPTKEAQEFHLDQSYYEGLAKLQAREYTNARELFESVLNDPLISSSRADTKMVDCHLLQLRFLTLKNLASVFLQQHPSCYESALNCYLQAIEIDNRDYVLWNQLGTVSCSMGLLSISRWAFEQGLLCSPNNWNCMQKLLEVLIAIGDEIACLSVTELILRHWPRHSRALHVKRTIEDTEPDPFSPRGIDKLEPLHSRLKFSKKRKASYCNSGEDATVEGSNHCMELKLHETSWSALTGALLRILSESGSLSQKNRNIPLHIHLLPASDDVMQSVECKESTVNCDNDRLAASDDDGNTGKEKDGNINGEHSQGRRSSRLERLRNRKPEKEESETVLSKDMAKVTMQRLQPFIIDGKENDDFYNLYSPNELVCVSPAAESTEVVKFINETSKNYGAQHMGNLLLEAFAGRGGSHHDPFFKILELEKLSRSWGEDRTQECSLFLAELYYDFAICSFESSVKQGFLSDSSYHLCKIIESVALNYPVCHDNVFEGRGPLESNGETRTTTSNFHLYSSVMENPIFVEKSLFWARFFWLSGRLSVLEDSTEKAHNEFCVSFLLLTKKNGSDDAVASICRPYCVMIPELTGGRVMHEINLLEVSFLLRTSVGEMMEKGMNAECVNSIAPLLFSSEDVYSDLLPSRGSGGDCSPCTQLSALDVLIKAGEKFEMGIHVCLNSHYRKLQMLMFAAGVDQYRLSHHNRLGSEVLHVSELREQVGMHWNDLISEEVKAFSQFCFQLKNFYPNCDSNGFSFEVRSVGVIQSLLMAVMHNSAKSILSHCTDSRDLDQSIQGQKSCFIDACILFCRLQQLGTTAPVKNQVQLIVTIHDLLAEYGICCGGTYNEKEGAFLKFAIKYLLALDTKLKSSAISLHKGQRDHREEQIYEICNEKELLNESSTQRVQMAEVGRTEREEVEVIDRVSFGENGIPYHECVDEEKSRESACIDDDMTGNEKGSDHITISEDERGDLESLIDNALDQCFFCLYGLNLRSDSSYEDDLAVHKNTSRGNYQTKEHCYDVFQYILTYAKASTRAGMVKLRRVLRTIRKYFPQPPDDDLAGNPIDKFLNNPDLVVDEYSVALGSDRFSESMVNLFIPSGENAAQPRNSSVGRSETYLEVYSNLYFLMAQSEELSASDKWPGFIFTKEGADFVEQNTNLFKYDLIYNPRRFESWQKLSTIFDEEVDLLLNDGSKHINVLEWRKNIDLSERVVTSRQKSRRCLLMSLALATTPIQQCEIHELLALVYYDSVQNVVPLYDQRNLLPTRDESWLASCRNSKKHFEEAFSHRKDWSHAFYLGKLNEKLGHAHELSFSFYNKAIALNPSAVDPFYRLHASRLKLLCTCGKDNAEIMKVISKYSYQPLTKEGSTDLSTIMQISAESENPMELWNLVYRDCISALQVCVEGDLKHFHKARHTLAQGLYRRGESGDTERAKDELSFCFKSSRSSFTINMWEIDSMVKRGRRKIPGVSNNKRVYEVYLAESSRKFITCIRKYLLFYLKLLAETGDILVLERAYMFLRTDKRFSLCLEDLVPIALGMYIEVLISLCQANIVDCGPEGTLVQQLNEKLFSLFLEQGNLWPEICNLPEFKSNNFSEFILYEHLKTHIQSLEKNVRVEALEGIVEKMKKRHTKNPKNTNFSEIYNSASTALFRSIVTSLALITPLPQTGGGVDPPPIGGGHQLFLRLEPDLLWANSFSRDQQTLFSNLCWVPLKKASEKNLDAAATLLRVCYNLYKDGSSSSPLPLVASLYSVPLQMGLPVHGVDPSEMTTPRMLLLWAYTLVYGGHGSLSAVVKHCEEMTKTRSRRCSSAPSPDVTVGGRGSHGRGGLGGSEVEASVDPSMGALAKPNRVGGAQRNMERQILQKCEKVCEEIGDGGRVEGDP